MFSLDSYSILAPVSKKKKKVLPFKSGISLTLFLVFYFYLFIHSFVFFFFLQSTSALRKEEKRERERERDRSILRKFNKTPDGNAEPDVSIVKQDKQISSFRCMYVATSDFCLVANTIIRVSSCQHKNHRQYIRVTISIKLDFHESKIKKQKIKFRLIPKF